MGETAELSWEELREGAAVCWRQRRSTSSQLAELLNRNTVELLGAVSHSLYPGLLPPLAHPSPPIPSWPWQPPPSPPRPASIRPLRAGVKPQLHQSTSSPYPPLRRARRGRAAHRGSRLERATAGDVPVEVAPPVAGAASSVPLRGTRPLRSCRPRSPRRSRLLPPKIQDARGAVGSGAAGDGLALEFRRGRRRSRRRRWQRSRRRHSSSATQFDNGKPAKPTKAMA